MFGYCKDLIADVKDQVQTITYGDSFIAQNNRGALLIALRNQLSSFLMKRSNQISHVVILCTISSHNISAEPLAVCYAAVQTLHGHDAYTPCLLFVNRAP
jgi:hypothetical protein